MSLSHVIPTSPSAAKCMVHLPVATVLRASMVLIDRRDARECLGHRTRDARLKLHSLHHTVGISKFDHQRPRFSTYGRGAHHPPEGVKNAHLTSIHRKTSTGHQLPALIPPPQRGHTITNQRRACERNEVIVSETKPKTEKWVSPVSLKQHAKD